MSATHTGKQETIDFVRERFENSASAVLLDFTRLDVASEDALRIEFRKSGVQYKVVKNSLVRRAVAGTPLETDAFTDVLAGPTAIAWSDEDPSLAAKVIKAFRKDEEKAERLRVKCAVLEGQVMAAARVETELASLPGKDEVRAMLLAQLMAPMQKLVMQLGAPGQNLAYVLDARQRQLGEGG